MSWGLWLWLMSAVGFYCRTDRETPATFNRSRDCCHFSVAVFFIAEPVGPQQKERKGAAI